MKSGTFNGVPIGDLNREGLDLLDETILESYAAHYAHYGHESERRYFRLLTQIVDIYKNYSAHELVDLFQASIPFPSYPWFQHESLASYLNFAAQYIQRLATSKQGNRPNIPLYAFPKTGSSFIATTFANALDIPFGMTSVENRFAVAAWSKIFKTGPGILHDHLWMDKSNSEIMKLAKFDRMIIHIRDPRQVIISIAHHVLNSPATAQIFGGVHVVELQTLSPNEIIQNIIDRGRFVPAYGRWIDSWLAERNTFRIKFSHYETMNSDIYGFFDEILQFCDADQNSVDATMTHLENQPKAEIGTNFNFRNGSSDEWKNILSDKQKDTISRQMQGTSLHELYQD